MKKWLVRIGIVVGILLVLGVGNWYFTMRSMGFFREPVFETVAPELPELSRPAILVFSKTNAFIHKDAIPAAKVALQAMAESNGWSTYFTDNGAVHNSSQLAQFDAIVWNNVSGDVLTAEQRRDFKSYIENGGGFVGIHAAGDNSHEGWSWYTDTVIRAKFTGHPMSPQFQDAVIRIEDVDNPIVRHLPPAWERNDEWYSFEESPRKYGSHILGNLDESTYSPEFFGKDIVMGDDHPVIWQHCIKAGRIFYSALGHTAESFSETAHTTLLRNAIAWAAGLEGGYTCDVSHDTVLKN